MGPRELARNAEPPWPSPARRALARAAPLASSGAPRPFCCPGEGGVGHGNGFSFLSARTTPCIDALRACLSSPRPNQQARVPHGGLSLRPARSLPPRSRGCASLPRVAQPAHARIAPSTPHNSRTPPFPPIPPTRPPISQQVNGSQASTTMKHLLLRAVPRHHRGDPPPLFGLRLPLREEGALGLGRPRHHPQRAPRGVVLEGPGRGTSKREWRSYTDVSLATAAAVDRSTPRSGRYTAQKKTVADWAIRTHTSSNNV